MNNLVYTIFGNTNSPEPKEIHLTTNIEKQQIPTFKKLKPENDCNICIHKWIKNKKDQFIITQYFRYWLLIVMRKKTTLNQNLIQ